MEVDGTLFSRETTNGGQVKTFQHNTAKNDKLAATKNVHFFIGGSWQPSLPKEMSFLAWNCRGLGHPSVIATI
jgi:hypothetical protein